jgi:hypothetical protein
MLPPGPLNYSILHVTPSGQIYKHHVGLLLKLKWSKTHQGAHPEIHIPLPRIQGSRLCPTRAFQRMCAVFPTTSPTMPLLVHGALGQPPTLVTTRMLAKLLRRLICQLRLPPSQYTLHSLRQGGATYCHSLGIPVEQIKSHGTWASDTVWTYINPTHTHRSVIPTAMSKAIQAALVQH